MENNKITNRNIYYKKINIKYYDKKNKLIIEEKLMIKK